MPGLLAIARTQPIISTFGADALRESPAAVRESYDWYASTYVEQGPLAALRRRFIDAVRSRTTPKACLVAPFGYGKTASAVGIWRACQAEGIMAIPPLSCGSFTEVARALVNWLTFTLPEFGPDLQEAHDRFLASSAMALARRDERLFEIPYEKAFAAISDKLERGYLDFEDVSINLLAFLERVTELVEVAGYSGLVVIIDEMQQLLGNANKGVLVALRQLIWGLRTRSLPLGLLLTMDPASERALADRAGDVLHRIKDDGLYLDIHNIYDRSFPARLWQQYVATFDLGTESGIVDPHCLEALGQLCEREDLSNGPRTVINALQLAASVPRSQGTTPFSPIDLVDGFLAGTIRFDGDRAILPSLVGELLNFPYFQRSADRSKLLKLIGAFPRGCPRIVAATYGLESTWQELSDDLRGEIVTELDEGLALIGLQRIGRPANQLNMLLHRYWMQITDEQLFAEDAPRAFADLVLPLLFPPKVHDLNGWSGVRDIALTIDGCYAGIIEGTSSTTYPLRRLAVVVLTGDAAAPPTRDTADVDFEVIFRLSLDSCTTTSLRLHDTGTLELQLAIGRPAEGGLGASVAWIEHYLSPHPLSAAVVLSLLRYFGRQGQIAAPPRDQARIDDTLLRLRSWLLADLLPPDVLRGEGLEVFQGGQSGLHEFLFLLSSRRWPGYHALASHQHWTTLLGGYLGAIGRITPAQRVGGISVCGTKEQIAALFGQTRHAGFDSRARQYGDLLRIEQWSGSAATIRFLPHPLEIEITDLAREAGTINRSRAYQHLRLHGLAAVEAEFLLRMSSLRGMLDEEAGILRPHNAPSSVELVAQVRRLVSRVESDPELIASYGEQLTVINNSLNQRDNSTEIAWQIEQLEGVIDRDAARVAARTSARETLAHTRLVEQLPLLVPPESPGDTGNLSSHLTAVHNALEDERRQLCSVVERLIGKVSAVQATDLESAIDRTAAWHGRINLYHRWIAFAVQLAQMQRALVRLDMQLNLPQLHVQLEGILADARAVLAQIGLSALTEIGRLEISLRKLVHIYEATAAAREIAYMGRAAHICGQAAALVGLPNTMSIPPYDPANNDKSLADLDWAIAALVSKGIALLALQVVLSKGSSSQKLALAKLRSDIRATAKRAVNPQWLLAESGMRFRPDATRAVNGLRARVARQALGHEGEVESAPTQVARTLAVLAPGPINIMSILDAIGGTCSSIDILTHLTALHAEGMISLTIELLGEGK